jgi:UDP-N-acetylglucosamine--N-acetylmuramyl-(pentapeptide) pyrophosphoryl-undecaprenol N-acetylglucosamine transferase
MKLLIAGGGTGGHVLAGIAIADEWAKRFGKENILFVGSSLGLEARLVPAAGYPLKLLPVGALNQVSFMVRIKTMMKLPLCFLYSTWILLRFRPNATLGVGGYASGPVVLVASLIARLWSGKTAVLEQNLVPGYTNRKLSQYTDRVFVAFEEASANFPKNKVLVSGNPIRAIMKDCGPVPLTPKTLFIFGGSQGAMGINTMMIQALPSLKDQGLYFIHQTGRKDFERVANAYQTAGIQARVEPFIDDMLSCYQSASLILCRAGSSTLAEISRVGRPAVFIPLPTAADNHQEKNAEVFARADAAQVIRQGSLSGEDLADSLLKLLEDLSALESMAQNVRKFYKPDAAHDIVQDLSR